MKQVLLGHHSHRGPRETNQDTVLSIELPDGRWLAAVADGMGGLKSGERASKTALGALYRHLSNGSGLTAAMMEANAAVFAEGQDMGTTLVAALLSGTVAEIANVGDSRAYHFDPLGLVQVTRDHTMGQDALQDGSVSEEEATSSPWSGALSRYLGAEKEVEIDHFGPLDLHEGGWLLLCSDGLHRVFTTDEMEGFLRNESGPEETAQQLVEEALERETEDNVSVALVFHSGEATAITQQGEPERSRSSWDPERLLIRPHRPETRKRRGRPLAVLLPMVLIPLLVGLFFVVRWWLSSGAG